MRNGSNNYNHVRLSANHTMKKNAIFRPVMHWNSEIWK